MPTPEFEVKLQRCEALLEHVEHSLKTLVTIHGIGSRLIDEMDCWNALTRQPRLHRGGLETYQFEKVQHENWPSRVVRWVEENSHCLIQVYADEPLEKFKMWSRASKTPFGQDGFQETHTLQLPEDLARLPQLLEESYTKLQEATI